MAAARGYGDDLLERVLQEFGKNELKPSEEAESAAAKVVSKLTKALQQKMRKYRIQKVIPSGSYGKSTSLDQHFDIDLVAFINNCEPSDFKRILTDFEQILDMTEGLNVHDVHLTPHSVQFKLDGFEIDLLPAANYFDGADGTQDEIRERQRVLTLAKIQSVWINDGKYDSRYSSSLAASQVHFMTDKSAFIHSLIRLCKFWMKTLQLDYIYGKSLIIELVATLVGQDVENNPTSTPTPMKTAFDQFLNKMINFGSIEINLKPDCRTPREILTRPYIIDPTNPYNNVVQGLDRKTIEKLGNYARETKKRLENFYRCLLLEVLFDPQPAIASLSYRVPVPLVDIQGSVPYTHPNMIVRKGSKFRRGELDELKNRIQQSVVTKVQAKLANGKPANAAYDIQEVVMNMVQKKVRGESNLGNWTHCAERHEDYDVTFVIPFVMDDCKMSCWVSFQKN